MKLFAKAGKSGKGKTGKKQKKAPRHPLRRLAAALVALAIPVVLGLCGASLMRSDPEDIAAMREVLPEFLFDALEYCGTRVLFVTDAVGWTGHDVVYGYDTPPPANSVFFAGAPERVGSPAPEDIKILDRGDFVIGWSDSLRRAVWVAYHVPPGQSYKVGPRPSFKKDPAVKGCPGSDVYTHTGFDRGHMAPNHAIASRFGANAQAQTFLMSNIAPQSPELNRGIWREVELTIADLWADKDLYGEIWVIVGAIPSGERIGPIDIPSAFYMIVVAETESESTGEGGNEEPYEVRAIAMVFPQEIDQSGVFAMNYLSSIDDIEKVCGLDFMPDLPGFIQEPLEADCATRLWPVGFSRLFQLFSITSPIEN